MESRGIFRGYALQAVDAKGRVAIPAGLRATIERNSPDKFLVLSKHESDACLVGYDREFSPILHARLQQREAEDRAAGRTGSRHNINRAAFGLVEDVSFDSSGRFILPSFMRKKAGIEDWAFFLATGDTFDIWNPDTALASETLDEDTKDVIRHLKEERGIA